MCRLIPYFILPLGLIAFSSAIGQDDAVIAPLFPSDGGVVDARQFGAIPDDDSDDTAAIQAALDAYPDGNRILQLQAGTYILRDTVRWPANEGTKDADGGTILEGAGSAATILRVPKKSPRFAQDDTPRAVLSTSSNQDRRRRNAIRGLSIVIEEENPAAIGLQFRSVGQGIIRDVAIRGLAGTGKIGLDLSRGLEIGPLLVRDCVIEGFHYGIVTKWPESSTVVERIHLTGQRGIAWWNYHQAVAARKMSSENAVPAFYNEKDSWGAAVFLDSRLLGVDAEKGAPGIHNQRQLYLRNVEILGYRRSVDNDDKGRDKGDVDVEGLITEDSSHKDVKSLFRSISDDSFATAGEVAHLPVKDPPEIPWNLSGASWVNVLAFGADPSGETDASAALQGAIDSGAETVYLPGGMRFRFTEAVEIRGPVQRIVGLEGRILPDGKPVWRVVDGKHPQGLPDAPAVIIERMDARSIGRGSLRIRQESVRTLVVASSSGFVIEGAGQGDLFLEDVEGNLTSVAAKQSAWCRQLTLSGEDARCRNEGGNLWVLGLKAATTGTVIETTDGGTTEIHGLLLRPSGEWKAEEPAFAVKDAKLQLFGVSERDSNLQSIPLWVRETQGEEVRELVERPWVFLGK